MDSKQQQQWRDDFYKPTPTIKILADLKHDSKLSDDQKDVRFEELKKLFADVRQVSDMDIQAILGNLFFGKEQEIDSLLLGQIKKTLDGIITSTFIPEDGGKPVVAYYKLCTKFHEAGEEDLEEETKGIVYSSISQKRMFAVQQIDEHGEHIGKPRLEDIKSFILKSQA